MFIISALNVYIYSINAAEALLHFLPSFSLLTQSGQDGPTLTSTFLTLVFGQHTNRLAIWGHAKYARQQYLALPLALDE